MSVDKEGDEVSIAVDLAAMGQFETPAPESEPDGTPFGAVSVCKTAEHTTSLVASIISDRLSQNDSQKTRLVTSLTTYFGKVGTDNEETFAFMGKENSLTTEGIQDEALTLPVMLCLRQTAALTDKAIRAGNHLTRLVTFQQLE